MTVLMVRYQVREDSVAEVEAERPLQVVGSYRLFG